MPQNFETMREIAETIAAHFGLMRVDLYSDGETCMVGEITNCANNAGARFFPRTGEQRASEIIFSDCAR